MSDNTNDDGSVFGAITAVAHELRTPLTAIQGAVEILQDEAAGTLTPVQREFVGLAYRNLARLKDRIEDSLDIATLQRQGLPRASSTSLAAIARRAEAKARIESDSTLRLRVEGFEGEIALAILETTLCRSLGSVAATVGRHARSDDVLLRAIVLKDEVRFEAAAESGAGADNTVIHDASLALARQVIQMHGGSLRPLESGRCGVYVLLPRRPIRDQEE